MSRGALEQCLCKSSLWEHSWEQHTRAALRRHRWGAGCAAAGLLPCVDVLWAVAAGGVGRRAGARGCKRHLCTGPRTAGFILARPLRGAALASLLDLTTSLQLFRQLVAWRGCWYVDQTSFPSQYNGPVGFLWSWLHGINLWGFS